MVDLDEARRQAGSSAARGLDLLDDLEVVEAITAMAGATADLIRTVRAKRPAASLKG